MAFIRPFKPADTEDCKAICRETLPPSLACSPAAVTMAPYLWTLQFTHLFPEHCFVLDDGKGFVVGYVIGAPDVFALAEKYPRYVEEVLKSEQGLKDVPVPKQLEVLEAWNIPDGKEEGRMVVNAESMAQNAYKVEWLVLDGAEGKRQLVEGWRAMLHIDILEGWQGQGWGRKMVERFVESVKGVKEEGRWDVGKGIQLGVAAENTKVIGFYEKLGFRVYPGGEKEGVVWMVRDV